MNKLKIGALIGVWSFAVILVSLWIASNIIIGDQVKAKRLIIITSGNDQVMCEDYEVNLSGYIVARKCWKKEWSSPFELKPGDDVYIKDWSSITMTAKK